MGKRIDLPHVYRAGVTVSADDLRKGSPRKVGVAVAAEPVERKTAPVENDAVGSEEKGRASPTGEAAPDGFVVIKRDRAKHAAAQKRYRAKVAEERKLLAELRAKGVVK